MILILKPGMIVLAILAVVAIATAQAPAPPAGRPQAADGSPGPVALTGAERSEILKGKIVLRDVANPGLKGRTYEAIGTLPGTIDDVFAVILDYRHYDKFMPRVERMDVTDEGPMVSLVEQYLKLPLGAHRRYRLRYSARREPSGFRVDWVQVPWPEVPESQTVAETSGHWQVEPDPCGALLAVYHVYTDPGHVPLGMTGLALSLSKHEIPKMIEAVRDRLRRSASIKN